MIRFGLVIFFCVTTSLIAKYNITSCSNSKTNMTLLYHWQKGYSPAKISWKINDIKYEKPELYIRIIGSRKNLEKLSSGPIEQLTFYAVKMEILIKATDEVYADWFLCEERKGG